MRTSDYDDDPIRRMSSNDAPGYPTFTRTPKMAIIIPTRSRPPPPTLSICSTSARLLPGCYLLEQYNPRVRVSRRALGSRVPTFDFQVSSTRLGVRSLRRKLLKLSTFLQSHSWRLPLGRQILDTYWTQTEQNMDTYWTFAGHLLDSPGGRLPYGVRIELCTAMLEGIGT